MVAWWFSCTVIIGGERFSKKVSPTIFELLSSAQSLYWTSCKGCLFQWPFYPQPFNNSSFSQKPWQWAGCNRQTPSHSPLLQTAVWAGPNKRWLWHRLENMSNHILSAYVSKRWHVIQLCHRTQVKQACEECSRVKSAITIIFTSTEQFLQ